MTSKAKLSILSQYIVPILEKKIRFQDLEVGVFTTLPTKSSFKKAIKKKLLYLNDEVAKTGDFISGGETITLYQDENSQKPKIAIDLEIIFEDDYLALVNKPAGITVSGNKKWTLENALSSNLNKSTQADALLRPEPVHRLDHPTSGILLIAKTSKTLISLNQLFENRTIQKTYFAITIGKQNESGILEDSIDGKPAKTRYVLKKTVSSEKFDFLNLVVLHPESGRKHQIRKHLLSIGNPILGDKTYFLEHKILKGNGLYLHAHSLNFLHPITQQKMMYSAKLPKKFTRIFGNL